MAKEPKKLDDLFHDTLKDIYFAEKKILTALPKMAKAAQSDELRAAFEKHHAETDSAVAGRLLKDWPAAVEQFTAVVPRDYKRVMELIRTAEAAGRNVDEAVMGVTSA